MSRHDANRLTYDEVTIFGVPALFTDLRVDRSTVPDGVYRYEVRYSDEYGGEPVELARGILVDFRHRPDAGANPVTHQRRSGTERW